MAHELLCVNRVVCKQLVQFVDAAVRIAELITRNTDNEGEQAHHTKVDVVN